MAASNVNRFTDPLAADERILVGQFRWAGEGGREVVLRIAGARAVCGTAEAEKEPAPRGGLEPAGMLLEF